MNVFLNFLVGIVIIICWGFCALLNEDKTIIEYRDLFELEYFLRATCVKSWPKDVVEWIRLKMDRLEYDENEEYEEFLFNLKAYLVDKYLGETDMGNYVCYKNREQVFKFDTYEDSPFYYLNDTHFVSFDKEVVEFDTTSLPKSKLHCHFPGFYAVVGGDLTGSCHHEFDISKVHLGMHSKPSDTPLFEDLYVVKGDGCARSSVHEGDGRGEERRLK